MSFLKIFSLGNGGGEQQGSKGRKSRYDYSHHDDHPTPEWIQSSDVSEDVQSIQSDALSDISPIQITGTFGSIDDDKWRKPSVGYPTDVRDMETAWDATNSGLKHPYEFNMNGGLERSHSQLFRALDRILSNISEDTDSVKADDATPIPFDLMDQPQRSMSTEDEKHAPVESPEIVPFGDVRILALGLVGHGHMSIPATIVKNSLECHLDFVVESDQLGMEVHDYAVPGIGRTEQVEEVVKQLISEKRYDEVATFFRISERSKDRGPQTMTRRTLNFLAVLNALAGKKQTSLKAAKRSLKISRAESNQAESSLTLSLIGLVYLRFANQEKAMNALREALQMVISTFGYDHPYVAKLLNNLGCLHYLQGDFATSLQLFSESMELNRKVLRSSVEGADSLLLDISLAKGNIAMILARSGKTEAAGAVLEEVLSLQESMTAKRAEGLADVTKATMERLSDRLDTSGISAGASSKFFGSKSDLSDYAADQTMDTFRCIQVEESKPSVFGNDDGIPMRRSGNKSPIHAIDASDYLDAILLGSLMREYTPKQRVRAAVLRWFDKTLQDEEREPQLPFVPYQSAFRKRARIPIDVDTNEAIDAELHLQEITEQALDHLEHNEIEEALELFQSSLYSHREKYGAVHHLVGMAFHNIGMVHLYAQKYSQALTAFQEAVSVRRSALGSDHPAVATSLTKIGMIFLLQRDPEGAKEAFNRAMKVIKKSMGCDSMQMARVLNNIGVAQYETGADAEALQTLREARDIQERLLNIAKSEGGVLKIQTKTIELSLANTLCNMGFLHCRQKKYKESYGVLKKANRLWKKHGGIFSPDVYCMDENMKHVRGIVESLERREAENSKSVMGIFIENLVGNMRCAA